AVIDVQEKLMPVIDSHPSVVANIERLVRGFHLLGIPALLTEQYVKGLGATVKEVRQAFEETHGYAPLEKACFSAAGCDAFAERLGASGRHQVVLAGVEAHVCVTQTALDLLEAKYEVYLAADAISSRTSQNRDIAFRRLISEGARLVSTEMALFEVLGVSGTDEFKRISKLIK
ncbi:MAG TPA: hydrolase, partial [Thermoanaerobaculia bacterium]|nr:hydrolase [Thermoanaerobaculia bacterium]